MTKTNDGGPAFPVAGNTIHCTGMTLRDWFAGMAMQGAFASGIVNMDSAEKCASAAYKMADAMLKAREETR